jgi:CelD/BcsL family acetyltransferase involved in cellulose biosynthesis
LRLGILHLNSVPVAAQLWLTHGGVASIYKLAYDEEASRYSAGTVLTAAMFEQALDRDHVVEIDYLNGDEPYKRDWMSHRRERRGIIAFDLSQWKGFKAALRHWAGLGLKPLLRHLRPDTQQAQ